jgi:hypothetical protein
VAWGEPWSGQRLLMRGPIVARQEGGSQAHVAGSASLLKRHQNVRQESSRGVYDRRHMSSAPRASPVVFRPHRWQGCHGQVWPGWIPRSPSSTVWRPRRVSALPRVGKSRSSLACHHAITAYAIVWWKPSAVMSRSCSRATRASDVTRRGDSAPPVPTPPRPHGPSYGLRRRSHRTSHAAL